MAEDWFDPATASLGRLSFRLHRDLAEQYDGRQEWGYSKGSSLSLLDGGHVGGGSGDGDWLDEGRSRAEAAGVHEIATDGAGPGWLRRRKGDEIEMLGQPGSTAQVDPLRLSHFLLKQSLLKGVRFHHPARAVKIARDAEGNLSGVRIRHASGSEHKIPCTRLLITAGAWTPRVFAELFPNAKTQIPISQLAGHSIVVKSPRWTKDHESVGCHGIFTSMRSGFSPEIFSRVGEEIYIAGLNSPSMPLPEQPGNARIDERSIEQLIAVSRTLLGKDGLDPSDVELVREGLCFRPVTRSGNPILAKIADEDLGGEGARGIKTLPVPDGGVFVCAGHGPWGISLSLGTGKVMAEMLEGRRELSADVSKLGMR